MKPHQFFSTLESVTRKPAPWAAYTARELWTDAHTSERMLGFHLDGTIDVSSRRTEFIDESVAWMARQFSLREGSKIIDFGCGPGLYTSRFSRLGADVCGVDFSSRSIAHARRVAENTGDQSTYIEADYLEFEPEGQYDLITMIMCDFCALAPAQRAAMLTKFRDHLSGEGRVVLDVYSLRAFESKQETTAFGKNLMDGFWSPDPYFCFTSNFKYAEEELSLDKYTIVERDQVREVYNWLQYFSPLSLEREVRAAGLEVETLLGNVAGVEYDDANSEFAVVLKAPGVQEQR